MMHHIGNPVTALQTDAVKAAAGRFGLDVAIVEVRRAEDIVARYRGAQGRADALIVPSEPLYNTNRIQINSWALKAQLPTIYFDRVYVETGGLMSYGPNWPSCGIAPPRSSTKSYAEQNRPISRSSSRGRLNWSLTSRPQRRSASKCRRRCSPAQTR